MLADNSPMPFLTPCSGKTLEGLMLSDCGPEALARLAFYGQVYDCALAPISVSSAGEQISAQTFQPVSDSLQLSDENWSLSDWTAGPGPLMREAAHEVMRYFGEMTSGDVASRLPVIRTRAHARLNAFACRSATRFQSMHQADDVEVDRHEIAFSGFFSVERAKLRHRTFDGRWSGQMTREVFMASDAVTVLPYDPKADRVLLIEQFRAPMMFRGDPNPWAVEAIAGRIDPGEDPERTAYREAREEAGLELGQLLRVGRYYIAPGATTEYIHSFVALCDLSSVEEGIGGLDDEAEDIRFVTVDYAEFDAALAAGEINVGPLLLSGLWLQRERPRLRTDG